MRKKSVPILEFDEDKEALISPFQLNKKMAPIPSRLVITFFKDAINQLLEEKKIEVIDVLRGENELTVYRFVDTEVALIHGVIGGPACGGFLEDLIGLGVTHVMFCGGAGVLDKQITVGKFLVVESAIRDEGVSYHYVAPSRIIDTQPQVVDKITQYLDKNHFDYLRGRTWTTDAFYRETRTRIQLRKKEGALMVEMEQASLIAITQFRGIGYGSILYGGDDVSGTQWDSRGWHSRHEIRYGLVLLCKEIVQLL